MSRFRLEILLVFLFSLAVRLAVFYSAPVPTGDAAQYASFVREIASSGGYIPAVNTVYFPGSTYIYPPFLFLMTYWLSILLSPAVSPGGFTYLWILLAVSAVFSSMTASLIYGSLGRAEKRNQIIARIIVLSVFSPDVFAFTWGGYPYVVSEFFLVLMIFSFLYRDKGLFWKVLAPLSIIFVGITHDLTFFVSVYLVLVFMVLDLIRKDFRKVKLDLIPLFSGILVAIIWWGPRFSFLLSAITTSQAQGNGPFAQISDPFLSFVGLVPAASVIVGLAIVEIIGFRRLNAPPNTGYLEIAAYSSVIALPFLLLDPAISARYVLYALDFLVIIAMMNLKFIPSMNSTKWARKIVSVGFAALLLMIPVQMAASAYSVSYYSTGTFQYDSTLVSWGAGNLSNGTVIAPSTIGEYLSAVDGAKVITYTGFFVGMHELAMRNAAAQIVLNPGSNLSKNYTSQYDIRYVVIEKSLVNTTLDGHYISFPSSMYRDVLTTQYYEVFLVI